jgi:hypothetical protein
VIQRTIGVRTAAIREALGLVLVLVLARAVARGQRRRAGCAVAHPMHSWRTSAAVGTSLNNAAVLRIQLRTLAQCLGRGAPVQSADNIRVEIKERLRPETVRCAAEPAEKRNIVWRNSPLTAAIRRRIRAERRRRILDPVKVLNQILNFM